MSEFTALPTPLIDAIVESGTALESAGVHYALIGGLATGLRSRPRSTRDVDWLLNIPQIKLPGVLADLQQRGFQFDERTAIEEYVRHHLTFMEFRGVRVDWMKPMVPAYQHVLNHATTMTVLDRSLRVASAEGLILLKLLASRPQDCTDVVSLLAANQGRLDLDWVEREWRTLYETDDPRWQWYQQAVAEYYHRGPAADASSSPRETSDG